MKFINLMGPHDDIDRVKRLYVKKYDIQIEDAFKELGSSNVAPLTCLEDYDYHLKLAEEYAKIVDADCRYGENINKDEAMKIIEEIFDALNENNFQTKEMTQEIEKIEKFIENTKHFINFEFDIKEMLKFKFIKFRFGKIHISSFKQFETYLSEQENLIFESFHVDSDYVWGVYFVPKTLYETVDAIFSSLHFERCYLPGDIEGTLIDAYQEKQKKLEEIKSKIEELKNTKTSILFSHKSDIASALKTLREEKSFAHVHKNAGITKKGYYVIVGWISNNQAKILEDEIKSDEKVVLIIENDSSQINSSPPTKLKNNIFAKPFEFFVKTYDLPNYNELDPTTFIALSYTLLFGIMFGDVGQGLALILFGILYYIRRKNNLGLIISIIGTSSTIFGFLYGSIFGYEHILHHIWINPLKSISTILIFTISIGIVLNLIAMIFNMINCFKCKNYINMIFGPNALTGFLFYLNIITGIIFNFLNIRWLSTNQIVIISVILLFFIMFRIPISKYLKSEKNLIHGSIIEFITESFFETFEILLSYFTNTLSYLRVGAFALCHAGMMSVVMLLAGANNQNFGNIFVVIFGNIFVLILEGIIVSIQVLRLEYYELFSRFFRGGGRKFVPLKKQFKI